VNVLNNSFKGWAGS